MARAGDQPTTRDGDPSMARKDNPPAATAVVPGHITGFFSAHPATDSARAGSRGAGIALTEGVEVTVSAATERGDPATSAEGSDPTSTAAPPPTAIRLNGESIAVDPVERVLAALGVDAAVDAETALPLGAGFGVSGALTLGTALAANAVFDCGMAENELITLAHRAEVDAGTGLGDVVAQARGGLPLRLEPGAPGRGALDGIPARPRIEYVTFGELSTASVLDGDTDRLSAAGERALKRLAADPTVPTFVACSRRFATEADLLTDDVADAVAAVEDGGGDAAMAMLGRTAFAVGTGLSDAGYDPVVCGVDPAGGRLVGASEPDATGESSP